MVNQFPIQWPLSACRTRSWQPRHRGSLMDSLPNFLVTAFLWNGEQLPTNSTVQLRWLHVEEMKRVFPSLKLSDVVSGGEKAPVLFSVFSSQMSGCVISAPRPFRRWSCRSASLTATAVGVVWHGFNNRIWIPPWALSGIYKSTMKRRYVCQCRFHLLPSKYNVPMCPTDSHFPESNKRIRLFPKLTGA